MPEITMPRLSDSMEEGTILKWLKSDGDEVSEGDELAEIETDKATMTYEADAAGVLEIVADEGQTLAIGEVIAKLKAEGDAEESSSDDEAEEEEEPSEDEADERGGALRGRGPRSRGARGGRGGARGVRGGARGRRRPRSLPTTRSPRPSRRRTTTAASASSRPPSPGASPASAASTSARCAAPARAGGS